MLTTGRGYAGVWFGVAATLILFNCGFASGYSGGDGMSEETAYILSSSSDWAELMDTEDDWGSYFKLEDNIDFDWGTVTPIGDSSRAFSGVLDGNGFTISNASVQSNDPCNIALFGYIGSGGQIRNLGVKNITVYSETIYNIGGLAGINEGIIEFCFITGHVEGTLASGSAGGLAAQNYGTIISCYSTASVSGTDYVGGLVGQNGGSVNSCYAAGYVSSSYISFGLVGYDWGGSIAACIWDVDASGTYDGVGGVDPDPAGAMGKSNSEMKMETTFTDAGWDFSSVWKIQEDISYPQFQWEDGGSSDKYSGGLGTDTDPYLIAKTADWVELMTTPGDWGSYFELQDNLDLTGITVTPVGNFDVPFNGSFYGGTFTISNVVIDLPGGSYTGLFGVVNSGGGQIANLGLDQIVVNGDGIVGGLAGINYGSISSCFVSGTVTGNGRAGVLVGENGGSITSCYATGSVSGAGDYLGGLVGDNRYGWIGSCYATASVSGNNYVGGLAGVSSGTIQYCYSTGLVTGSGWRVGGLVGSSTGTGIYSSVWDVQTSGQSGSMGGKGLTTAQMKTLSIYQNAGWHSGGWLIQDGQDYPRLNWEGTAGVYIPAAGTVPLSGEGLAGNPYLIETAEDFVLLSWYLQVLDKHIKLEADLDLKEVDLCPIGDFGPFTGSFDGQGHTVSHAAIDLPDNSYTGLFAMIGSGGSVTNLNTDRIDICGRYNVGAIAGRNSGNITGCSAAGTVTGDYHAGGLAGRNYGGSILSCRASGTVSGISWVGGLVGYNGDWAENGGTIRSCYSTGAVSGTGEAVGGLAGYSDFGTLTNCYAAGPVTGNDKVGGLIGANSKGKVIHCYSTGKPSGTSNVGGLCGTVTTGGNYEDTANFWDTETSETGSSAMASSKTTAEMKTQATFTDAGWDFVTDWFIPYDSTPRLRWEGKYAGSGTAGDPYRISSKEDLFMMMTLPEDWDKHFLMTADPNLAGYTFNKALIAPDTDSAAGFQGTKFTGVFDGGGHVIRNLTIAAGGANYIGLFGFVQNGQIRNLSVDNVDILGHTYAGGLVGYSDHGVFTSCTSSGTVKGNTQVGGLVAHDHYGQMTSCHSAAAVQSTAIEAGGLVGKNYEMTIRFCSANGTVSGTNYVGGLVGGASGEITGCFAAGDVSGGGTIGGLVGEGQACDIMNCYATGAVSGTNYVGGLAGRNYLGKTEFCYATGIVTGSNAGGLLGSGWGATINACYWDVDASGTGNGVGDTNPDPAGAQGKTTEEMKTLSTFAGWDFAAVWFMPFDGYPYFQWELGEKYSGGFGTVERPYEIADANDLLELAATTDDYDRHFVVVNDLDLSGHVFTMAVIAPDTDSTADSFQGTPFTGTFNGGGHIIDHLSIAGDENDFIGLFGWLGSAGQIHNLGLMNATIQGRSFVGTLAGVSDNSTINSCDATGALSGTGDYTGGLLGYIYNAGTVSNCSANVTVTGEWDGVGGLAGYNDHGTVSGCCATGTVSGTKDYIGGLLGVNNGGTISNCYARASAAGTGLYSLYIGGLTGWNGDGTIRYCYTTGSVSGSANVGGLAGHVAGSNVFESCFWDTDTSGTSDGVGNEDPDPAQVFGRTTTQLQMQVTFTGWDFTDIWTMRCEGMNYPKLYWQPVTAADWVCPEGVSVEDLAYFSGWWLQDDCQTSDDCGGTDLNMSGTVDLTDFSSLSSLWLEGI